MCLLALFFRVVEDAPIVAGANREEFYSRGGEPPRVLDGPGLAVAGVDPLAGGTWFGVNQRGVLIAVTNRPKSAIPAQPRSRGMLARDLLGCPTATAAIDSAARELERGPYAGCNLLCADSENAAVIHAGDWLRIRPLPPGIHVLTARDVNDATDARLSYALGWLSQRRYACAQECLDALTELCAQTGNGTPSICIEGERSGTVSSSLVALRQPLTRSSYLHAQGPPNCTSYADYSSLLLQILSHSGVRE